MKLSIIIPAYKEPFLQRTIDSLLQTSELCDQLEIIAVWDGLEFMELLNNDPRVKIVPLSQSMGMRAAINAGIETARGEYIMKIDAHCLVDQGFDRIMVANCADNWVVYPRRHALNMEAWDLYPNKLAQNSFHLQFPVLSRNGYGLGPMTSVEWNKKMRSADILDSMGFEGSCWMANKKYFTNCIGLLDDRLTTYGPYHSESTEVAMNYLLGGGEVKAITTTWYAHLRKLPRHYAMGLFSKVGKVSVPYTWVAKHWMNEEHGKPKSFSWLIDKFWPIPGWPDDWKEVWRRNLSELEAA